MPQYEIKVLREQTLVVDVPSTDEAARVAKTMVARDPALKLLGVVRLDLLEPTAPQGEAA
jgi:hypothetical protein